MNYKHIYATIIVLVVFIAGANFVNAQEVNSTNQQDREISESLVFPITELGNCSSKEECKTFCNAPENRVMCVDYAEKSGLVAKKQAKKIRKSLEREVRVNVSEPGPGGCEDRIACERYCSEEGNHRECISFSVKMGFISQEEADKVLQRVERGGPGGCKSERECRSFCENPSNGSACLEFAVKEGKITSEEAEFMAEQIKRHGRDFDSDDRQHGSEMEDDNDIDKDKAKEVIESIGGPGGCSNMEECGSYCGQDSNIKECMEFAGKHNLMPKDKIERIRKMTDQKGPGGCEGPQSCHEFCSTPGNGEVCLQFSIDNDLMPKEEIERVKREMEIIKKLESEGGPGGCDSRESCRDFCAENIKECVEVSQRVGRFDEMRGRELLERNENFRMRKFDDDHRDFNGEFDGIGEEHREDYRDFEGGFDEGDRYRDDHRDFNREFDGRGEEYREDYRDFEGGFDEGDRHREDYRDFEGGFDEGDRYIEDYRDFEGGFDEGDRYIEEEGFYVEGRPVVEPHDALQEDKRLHDIQKDYYYKDEDTKTQNFEYSSSESGEFEQYSDHQDGFRSEYREDYTVSPHQEENNSQHEAYKEDSHEQNSGHYNDSNVERYEEEYYNRSDGERYEDEYRVDSGYQNNESQDQGGIPSEPSEEEEYNKPSDENQPVSINILNTLGLLIKPFLKSF